ncbi:envelope stress response membrane protein PspC [Niveispirillum sp. KHB5.9]|uniref:envelope stress response membrane protein PspC n=1 Tax=Niveispirillum sp. KHB5.9 TaxID=3400269 RepID=UPI003A898D43
MKDRHGPGTPPPFPGRDQYRSRHGRGYAPGRSWEQEYFGKRPDQSWADYFGLGSETFCGKGRGSRRQRTDWAHDHTHHHDDGRHDTHRQNAEDEAMADHHASNTRYRLWRSRTDAKIAGVCGGIAEYANVDAWIVRVGFILGFFFFPPVAFFGYLILWWLLKERPVGLYETREEEVFWRSVATKPDQTLSGLRGKFRDLDRDIAKLEGFIASREYDLHRQFRDLEKK